jgi:hypothetical protein
MVLFLNAGYALRVLMPKLADEETGNKLLILL